MAHYASLVRPTRYRNHPMAPSSLKKLMRRLPQPEDFEKALNELDTESPRAAAVLAATWLEDILRLALLYKMRTLSDEDEDRLFLGTGPLSSFSTKIQLGYALSIYGPKSRHDLDSIREIRNAFAHVRAPISFDTKEIAARCASFHCLKILAPPNLTSRKQFTSATRILMIRLIYSWKQETGDGIPAEVTLLD